jgi:hypothetical protein
LGEDYALFFGQLLPFVVLVDCFLNLAVQLFERVVFSFELENLAV